MKLHRTLSLLFLLLFVLVPTIAQDTLALTTDALNARSGPGTQYEILHTLPPTATVALLERNDAGNWIYVRAVDSGAMGWVTRNYLNISTNFDVMSLPVQAGSSTMPEAAAQASSVNPANLINSGNGTLISNLNVRMGPGTENDSLGTISARTSVVIESRNQFGNWIIVHTNDGSMRGWVATRYVNFADGVDLNTLPVSSEMIGQSPAPSNAPAGEGSDGAVDFSYINLPEGSTGELMARLMSVPIFHNFDTPQVRSIYQTGQRLGNRPNVFMKAGDSMTAAQPFLIEYGKGFGYNLGNYGYLQDTINYFSAVSPRQGVENSFTNRSLSALVGGTANSVLDGLWSDPTLCPNDSPLVCEIKLTRPAVGLVLFGVQDMRVVHPLEFHIHMGQLVETMMANGVIPVLSTYHTHPTYYLEDAVIYNNVIVDIANQYGVPLINLWRATQPLPNNGTDLQNPVHLSQGADRFFDFTGEENTYGVNLRNLLNLQALDQLRNTILR